MDSKWIKTDRRAADAYFRKLEGPAQAMAKRHVTFGIARGAELTDASGRLKSTGRSPIGRAVFPISEDLPEKTVRRWLQKTFALPPET